MKILTNHLGYDSRSPKRAVIQAETDFEAQTLDLVDASGKVAARYRSIPAGSVAGWTQGSFHTVDFSDFKTEGEYYLRVAARDAYAQSGSFRIAPDILPHIALTDILFYFKGQRSSSIWDRADHTVPFVGNRRDTVDVHGGWYDASGDFSKYLSHLSYGNYMNPQQSPLVVWNLASSRALLEKAPGRRFPGLLKRLDEETAHGADFLARMQDPSGYFYMTVFDRWSKDVKQREICAFSTIKGFKHDTFQASYRQGGGMAIAALARAGGQNNCWGEYSPAAYLEKAARGFEHLEKHGAEYCDDGKENIIDDFCALLAAAELAAACRGMDASQAASAALSPEEVYLDAARRRSASLKARLCADENYSGWLRSDDSGRRPWFHAADAGLPVVALLRYMEIETEEKLVLEAASLVRTILEFELALRAETVNPFGLARHYAKAVHAPAKSSFFIPHDNETGYWWQGENARLGSLASAALWALRVPAVLSAKPLMQVKAGKQGKARLHADGLREFGTDQINWILGLNPFDACMLQGRGHNNPDYLDIYPNAPGGVSNGITGGFSDEADIAFIPKEQAQDPMNNWRWGEQWIPHGAWLFFALANSLAASD